MAKQIVCDFLVIGAGIVGITTAIELKKQCSGSVLVIEKEDAPGQHASGRNSGVIHSGIYYKPGLLKARFCVKGNRLMKEYCLANNIPVNINGKVIVAKSKEEIPVLEELYNRGTNNKIEVSWLDQKSLKSYEPFAKTVDKALYIPGTAIVNPKTVIASLTNDAIKQGIKFIFKCKWENKIDENKVQTSHGIISYKYLVNCAGLHADKIAHAFNVGSNYTIIPFAGKYHQLNPASNIRISGNIYPAPDLRYPFLGVHFTRQPEGKVTIGPNAMPLFGREQYKNFNSITIQDAISTLKYLLKLSIKEPGSFLSITLKEIQKQTKSGFFHEAAKLIENLKPEDIIKCDKIGIRAQLVDKRSGKFIDDFVIEQTPNSTHILNAISPAFTCAFPFSRHVVQEIPSLHNT